MFILNIGCIGHRKTQKHSNNTFVKINYPKYHAFEKFVESENKCGDLMYIVSVSMLYYYSWHPIINRQEKQESKCAPIKCKTFLFHRSEYFRPGCEYSIPVDSGERNYWIILSAPNFDDRISDSRTFSKSSVVNLLPGHSLRVKVHPKNKARDRIEFKVEKNELKE